MEAFVQPKSVEEKKNHTDLVTETDQAAERLIMGLIRSRYPHHQFIGEEEVAANGGTIPELTDEPTWMIDPVDGKEREREQSGIYIG